SGQGPPSTPTDTRGSTFTLGASTSASIPVTPALVQKQYTSNCNSQNCALAYTSSVTSGNVLALGIGWYNQSPPTTPTDPRGDRQPVPADGDLEPLDVLDLRGLGPGERPLLR